MISQDRNDVLHTFHYDGLGSTRALSTVDAVISDEYNYEAFGEQVSGSGATDNKYLYAGEQRDSDLGLDYLRARYLDVGVGRFTQQDTWIGSDMSPVTLNKYLYANADSVNYTDPTGNFSIGSAMSAVNIQGILAVSAVAIPTLSMSGSSHADINTGHAREYDTSAALYHYYEMESTICYTTSSACTLKSVFSKLRRFPAPGWDSSRMVNSNDITQISVLGIGGGMVKHTVTHGSHTVRNETLPGHVFEDGYVDRVVVKDGSRIKVQSIGEGINKNRAYWLLNIISYKPAFSYLDRQVMGAMAGI